MFRKGATHKLKPSPSDITAIRLSNSVIGPRDHRVTIVKDPIFAPIFGPHPGYIYPHPGGIPYHAQFAQLGSNQYIGAPTPINTLKQIPASPGGPVPPLRPFRPPFPHIGAPPNGPPRPPRPPGPPPLGGGPWPQPGFPWNLYYQFPFAYPQAIPNGDSNAVKPEKFMGKDPRLL